MAVPLRLSDADEHAEACGGTDGQRLHDQKPAVKFLGDDLRVTREAECKRKMLGEVDLRLIEMLARDGDSIAAEGTCCRPPTIAARRQYRKRPADL